jgi:hypothetical protein
VEETAWPVRAGRVAAALLGLGAVGYSLVTGLRTPGWSVADFFSYFTIESALLSAGVLLWGALAPSADPRRQLLRGAVTVCMATTGLVDALVLSGLSLGLTSGWVNLVLHRILPAVLVVDWLTQPPRRPLPYRAVPVWLLPPLVFAGYTLARGPVAHWYPYPFFDPRGDGYARVAVKLGGALVAIVVLSVALAWGARTARRRLDAHRGHAAVPAPATCG